MKWRPADEAGAKWLAMPGKEWHLSYVNFAPNTASRCVRLRPPDAIQGSVPAEAAQNNLYVFLDRVAALSV